MRRRLLVTAAFCGLTVFPLFAAAGAGPATTTQKARAYLISRYQQALAIDPDYLPLHYFLRNNFV